MSEVHARRLLVALAVLAVLLTLALVRPLWEALFLAAVLAAALRAPTEALARRLGGRRRLAAGGLVVGLVVAVLLPLAGVGALVVRQLATGLSWVRQTLAGEGVAGLVGHLPGPLQAGARWLLDLVPEPLAELQALIGQQGGHAAAAVGGALAATGTALFHAAILLIALFFFLADGPDLVSWVDARVPLRTGQFRVLVETFRRTSVSVLFSTAGSAVIQTTVGLAGFLLARAPNVLFLCVSTFVLGLVPAVGGGVVVAAAGLLLVAQDHTAAGVFLLCWGTIAVPVADNLSRPYLLRGGVELHGGIIFFALIGGIAAFGWIGFVLGPLVVTFLVSVASLYGREFGGGAGDGGATPSA